MPMLGNEEQQNNTGLGAQPASLGGFDPAQFGGAAGSIFSGIFGSGEDAYQDAMDQYTKYMNQAQQTQNPFYNAGKGAIGDYQNWLNTMKDPSSFINNLMGGYQQSPWAKFLTQQGTRSAQNSAAASGLTGSSVLGRDLADYSEKISSQDMGNWLNSVLGVNQQYGAGEGNLMNMGANSANALTKLLSNYGSNMGSLAYGKDMAEGQDMGNLVGGIASIIGML